MKSRAAHAALSEIARPAYAIHKNRGLCLTCEAALRKRMQRDPEDTELLNYERLTRPHVETWDEWQLLKADGVLRRYAPARLGMTPSAFESAIYHEGRRRRALDEVDAA